MSITPKPSAKSMAKQEKIKKLLVLLQNHGPLRPTEVVELSSDLTLCAANRYLSELMRCGNVKKIQAKGAPKNIWAYEFESGCGAKTDIVSLALSHPLHRITLSMVEKKQPDSVEIFD
jgi:hypothetical protein